MKKHGFKQIVRTIPLAAACGLLVAGGVVAPIQNHAAMEVLAASNINYPDAYGMTLLNLWDTDTSDSFRYALYDLNGDGVFEMIVSAGTCDADWCNYVFGNPRLVDDSYWTCDFLGLVNNNCSFYRSEDGLGIYAVSGKQGVQQVRHIYITPENVLHTDDVMSGYVENYYSNPYPIAQYSIKDPSPLSAIP